MRQRSAAYRLRRTARRLEARLRRARAKRIREFERQMNHAFFGTQQEPSWDQIRDGARENLLNAQGADPQAVRKIWETNQMLPPHLRSTRFLEKESS